MSFDELCTGKLCQQALDLLAVGAPSIIALFLIIYAHKTLAARLKESSDAKQTQDSKVYRVQLTRVWSVALILLVVHAGVFVWTQIGPTRTAQKGFVAGAFRGFEFDRAVDLESDPERLYVRVTEGGDNRSWIITGAPSIERETFKITSEGTTLVCPVDLTEMEGGPPKKVELKLERDEAEASGAFKLLLLPRNHNIAWSCQTLTDDIPPTQPANGGPLDVFDATRTSSEGAGEGDGRSWLEPLFGFGRAFAATELSDIDKTLNALNNDDFRIRLDARQVIASDFEPYREWAEYIARDEAAYQSGQSKYGRPPYRSRLGLVYALSRRHPLPREGMFKPVDVPDGIIDFVLEQALSEDEHLRNSAKRFAISYPGPDMIRRLDDLWAQAQAGADQDRRAWARELMTHFYYNRGILIILAARDHIADIPAPEHALRDLSRADALARELPDDMRLFEAAKIRYGIGWINVVGRNENLEGSFNEQAATAAFKDALELVDGREKEYPYAWQLPVMTEYLKNPDYGLFNK